MSEALKEMIDSLEVRHGPIGPDAAAIIVDMTRMNHTCISAIMHLSKFAPRKDGVIAKTLARDVNEANKMIAAAILSTLMPDASTEELSDFSKSCLAIYERASMEESEK